MILPLKSRGMSALLLSAVLISPAAGQKNPAGSNWPSFRGPNASGIAEGFSLPTTWDATTSKNILWKTPIPGLGHSSPIVWGNRIYVSTAISGIDRPELKVGLYGDIGSVEDRTSHRWIVYCLDRLSGKIIWEKRSIREFPRSKDTPSPLMPIQHWRPTGGTS